MTKEKKLLLKYLLKEYKETINEAVKAKVGDTVEVDMKKIKAFCTHPNQLSLIKKMIKNGEGTLYVSKVGSDGTYDVRGWRYDLLGDATIPADTIKKVK